MPILHLSGIDFHIFVGGGGGVGKYWVCSALETNVAVAVGNKSNGMCLSNVAVLCMTL